MRVHVETLAGKIGERNVWRPRALAAAADYIANMWDTQGYEVARYDYPAHGTTSANLEIRCAAHTADGGIMIVGAHYDSVPGSPGANDNASGVAVMLELSRHFARKQLAQELRFVAFVNEEPPFFKTDTMGSRVYVKMARARGDDIRAMFCLETVGFYSDVPGSQHYPPLFNLFYPDTGNFIGFVANLHSRALLRRTVSAFRAASDFPVEHTATLGFVPGVDWSDHWSFWREGIPAIMITDTAPYRYPHYHTPRDTPEKIDYPRLARLARGLAGALEILADSCRFAT
ncbi:MAG: M28 family metallopeptidase [Gammaproteobacteria bacterium]|nr:MAG: M28 family metallopeptidase [Gammaproteobacteria bacterium]